jgi:hypothetical protein
MLRGTLEEKLEEIKEVNNKVNSQREKGIRESDELDKLLERRHDLEIDIDRHLLNKEKIADSLLDYCFRHFTGISSIDGLKGGVVYSKNVFDRIPKVKEFVKQINKLKGEKILTTQGNKLETGIIAGSCEFKVEGSFRYLHVPVKQLFAFNSKSTQWQREEENFLYINPDIFSYSLYKVMNNRSVWRTDHSKKMHIGGPGPKETTIYLGDGIVEDCLERHLTIEISSTKRSVPTLIF